jgi:hypothetical protein
MEATMRSWRRAQNLTIEEALEDMYEHANSVSCLQLKSRVPLLSRQWREDIDYKLVRHMFMAEYGLPRSFDYLSYVKRILHKNVQHSIHIHVGTWLHIIAIVLLIITGVWTFRMTVDTRGAMSDLFDDVASGNMSSLADAGAATFNALENLGNMTAEAAASLNVSDAVAAEGGGGRRQLGGGGGEEPTVGGGYGADTDQTTKWTIVVCTAFGWGLVAVQVWLTVTVQHIWAKIFDARSITNEPDMASIEASMVEWHDKVDVILGDVETAEDYKAKLLQDKLEGKPQKTELQQHSTSTSAAAADNGEEEGEEPSAEKEEEEEELFSHHEEHRIAAISQLVALLDCFYAAVYVVHLLKLVREFYADDLLGWLFATAMLLGPSWLLVFVIAPRTTRSSALLSALVRLDVLLVAEVWDASHRMHSIRTQIRNETLARHRQASDSAAAAAAAAADGGGGGKQEEEEGTAGLAKGSGSMDQSQVQQLAGELFTLFDTDKSGQLTSRQFKRGLISLGVYIKKKDFLGLVHVIDVDQSGWISLEQWEAFLAMTDEELDALHVTLNSDGNSRLMPGTMAVVDGITDFSKGIIGTATLGILAPLPKSIAKALPGAYTPVQYSAVQYSTHLHTCQPAAHSAHLHSCTSVCVEAASRLLSV